MKNSTNAQIMGGVCLTFGWILKFTGDFYPALFFFGMAITACIAAIIFQWRGS